MTRPHAPMCQNQCEQDIQVLFHEPFAHCTPEDILSYFRTRQSVTYFPVIDLLETQRGKIDHILQNRFEFNSETHELSDPIPWMHNPSSDREWLILLHKFYYSVGMGLAFEDTQQLCYANKWMKLTESWIDAVPYDFFPSDVAGRRIQNWIFAHYYFVSKHGASCLTPEFYLKFLTSLARQVSYLCEHLSPARNHRTLELCAVFLAGVVFPELRDAHKWLEIGKAELVNNMQTDLLPDGVHIELSTDYHHLVLKNYLWIRRLGMMNHIAFPAIADEHIQKALEFALYAHKPDGMIPSLSDGDSRCFLDLLDQGYQLYGNKEFLYGATQGKEGTPPPERSKNFPHSGYSILRSGWGDGSEPYEDERYLIFDCGPIGAGNHGHLDLLSFEMAAYGQSLVVDPGRYTYDESGDTNWRVRFRETAAHNTVVVDGKNQTRYAFSKTRHKILGPAPDFELKSFVTQPGFDFLHGIARSHEYPVIHERKIFFVRGEYWIITDRLTADDPHLYDLRFHLSAQAHKNVSMNFGAKTLAIHSPHLIVAQPAQEEIHSLIDEGYISQAYGVKHPAPIIRFTRRAACTEFHTVLLPYQNNRPDIDVETLPVFCEGVSCASGQASALCVTVTQHDHVVQDYYFMNHAPLSGGFSFGKFTHQGAIRFLRLDRDGKILLQYSP